jgi:hypothetical protein
MESSHTIVAVKAGGWVDAVSIGLIRGTDLLLMRHI